MFSRVHVFQQMCWHETRSDDSLFKKPRRWFHKNPHKSCLGINAKSIQPPNAKIHRFHFCKKGRPWQLNNILLSLKNLKIRRGSLSRKQKSPAENLLKWGRFQSGSLNGTLRRGNPQEYFQKHLSLIKFHHLEDIFSIKPRRLLSGY